MKLSLWPKPFHYMEHVRIFLLVLCVILSLLVGSIFFFLYTRTLDTLKTRLHEQATTMAELVDQFRIWNISYNGVYVEKRSGVATNRHLLQAGINPDIRTVGGKTLTLRNHAIMTDEVSRLKERDGSGSFRMVGSDPLNRKNLPDALEKKALNRFSAGDKEYSLLDLKGSSPTYRFFRPLYADRSCQECHKNGRGGDGRVLGAVSITIPIGSMVAELRSTRLFILSGAVVTIGLFVAIAYLLTWRLATRLDEALQHLKLQATTDELTGLRNRRTIMKRLREEFQRSKRQMEPLCVMIADIDFFKRINDTYGHPFGDQVLQLVANSIRESVRTYDMVGRIGGEEFLVISPGVNLAEALGLAERIRSRVAEIQLQNGADRVAVTISIGLTILAEEDNDMESLLKRGDMALYKAKDQGRDCVMVAT